MLQVEAVGVVVQFWQVHAVQAEADRPSEELLGVHHVRCERETRSGDAAADAISSADRVWPCWKKTARQAAERGGEEDVKKGGNEIKTEKHGNMHRRADVLMCKQAGTEKTQHMRCKHARNHPQVHVCDVITGGGGYTVSLRARHEHRFQRPSSSAPVNQSVEKVGTACVSEKTFWGKATFSECYQKTCLFSVSRRHTCQHFCTHHLAFL